MSRASALMLLLAPVTGAAATLISAPTISGPLTNGSAVIYTPGVWSGGTVVPKLYRDGVEIAGWPATPYNYNSATDDGRSLQVFEANGAATAKSNVLITGTNSVYYSTGFDGADGTMFDGYQGWVFSQTPDTTRMKILSNDLTQYANTSQVWTKDAGQANHSISFTMARTSGDTAGQGSARAIYVRYTDSNNYVLLNIAYNGWSLVRRATGTNFTLQSFTGSGVPGTNLPDATNVELKVNGDFVQVWIAGEQAPVSTAQNGGLGYSLGGLVSTGNKVAIGGPANPSGLTFPYPIMRSAKISLPLANSITLNSVAEQDEAAYTPGSKRLRILAALTGSITQVQYLILNAAGRIAVNWTDIAGISGAAFDGVTNLLPTSLFGTNYTVWVRDKTNIGSAVSQVVASTPDAPAQSLTFGLNAGSYASSFVPQNLFQLFRPYSDSTGGGNFKGVRANVLTINEGTAFESLDATTFGIGDDGKPTIIPPGRTLGYIYDGQQFPAELYGDYDVKFTPGLTPTFNGSGGAMIIKPGTTINVAAGTATIRIQAPTGSWSSPYIIFTHYNGVPRTLPENSNDLFFTIYKQGADTSLAVNPASIAYHAPFAGGYLRWMGSQPINRRAETGVTFNTYTFAKCVNKNSFSWAYHGVPYDALIEAALAKNMIPWVNLSDMLSKDAAGVGALAQFLFDNVPTHIPIAVELSNEPWNFGVAFAQSADLNNRALAAGVINAIQQARELKQVITLFEAVFGANNPRLRFVLAWQFVNMNTSLITAMMNEGDLYQKIYGVAGGPYGGNHGDFADTAFMSAANRRQVVSAPSTFKTNWLAAHSADLVGVKNQWLAFHRSMSAYEASKGLPLGTFRRMAYKTSAQHWIEKNSPAAFTGSITSNVLTVTAATVATLEVGDVITGGRAITSPGTGTGGTGTYNVSAGADVASSAMTATTSVLQTATRQALHEMYISPEMGSIQVDFFTDLAKAGGDIVFFAGAGKRQASNYEYGQWQISDTPFSLTDQPYAAVAAWRTA